MELPGLEVDVLPLYPAQLSAGNPVPNPRKIITLSLRRSTSKIRRDKSKTSISSGTDRRSPPWRTAAIGVAIHPLVADGVLKQNMHHVAGLLLGSGRKINLFVAHCAL